MSKRRKDANHCSSHPNEKSLFVLPTQGAWSPVQACARP